MEMRSTWTARWPAEVGIEEVRARVLPHEKNRAHARAPAWGRAGCFRGGWDQRRPRARAGRLGIAIGAGTDIAIVSDVVLSDIAFTQWYAYHVGRKSYAKTVQSLAFACSFNAVGVPLATTGLVHPVWAMIAMAASVTAGLINGFGGRLLPTRTPPKRPPGGRRSPSIRGRTRFAWRTVRSGRAARDRGGSDLARRPRPAGACAGGGGREAEPTRFPAVMATATAAACTTSLWPTRSPAS